MDSAAIANVSIHDLSLKTIKNEKRHVEDAVVQRPRSNLTNFSRRKTKPPSSIVP